MSVAKVGSEILVNTSTSGSQLEQEITRLANGNFVVTWTEGSITWIETGVISETSSDGNGLAVKAQVFTAAGAKIGSEILVNTATAANQMRPHIAALEDGGFVVTWTDGSQGVGGAPGDSSFGAVKAQLFTAGGARTGSEILVNTATEESQVNERVTALENGGFAVVWSDFGTGTGGATGDSDFFSIKTQAFTSTGDKIGFEILANTATTGRQYNPTITSLANGGFVAAWEDYSLGVGGATGDTSEALKAQVFAADGTKIGSEIRLNTATSNAQLKPQIIGLENGGFVAAWRDNSRGVGGATGDTSGTAIKAQVFTDTGVKTGTEIRVNTATAGAQDEPQITALSGGGFVVSWRDASAGVGGATGDSSGTAIKAQVFTAAGAKTGSEILVNTATLSNQNTAVIAARTDGGFAIAWCDFSAEGTTGNIKAQAFSASGAKVGAEMLVNTATANDQSVPKIAALPDGSFVVTWVDGSLGVGGATGDASGTAMKAQVFSVNLNTTAPTITTAADQTVAENTTVVAALTSTDPDTGGTNPAVFNISGGADASLFEIVGGNLRFKAAKDYETQPHSYQVEVTASDGLNASSKTITVNLANVAGVTINGTSAADTIDATHAPAGQPYPTNEEDTIAGLARNDVLYGLGGNDSMNGGGGNDTLFGGDGDDVLNGGFGADVMNGGAGNDYYCADEAGDTEVELAGGGMDTVLATGHATLGEHVENMKIAAGTADINGTGNAQDNSIKGNSGHNVLDGREGNDTLSGGGGNDVLIGGTGKDVLNGGDGADRFVFNDRAESPWGGARDVIKSFVAGTDQIDLTGVDADSGVAGNQAFTFIGAGAFTRHAGELQVTAFGTDTMVSGDTDGNGRADFQILLTGPIALQATDFLL